MDDIQLNLIIDNPEDPLASLKKDVDDLRESHHKVRKKLFAEAGSLKKEIEALKNKNMSLEIEIQQIKQKYEKTTNKTIEFNYDRGADSLFSMQELAQEAN